MEKMPQKNSEGTSQKPIDTLVTLGYENVRQQQKTNEGKKVGKKEMEEMQDREAAGALISLIPSVLDQKKEIAEKELRIGYGAFRASPTEGGSRRLWGISEGRPLSKETIIRSMKAAVIEAAMREVLEVLGEVKVEQSLGGKPVPRGLSGIETLRINLEEILEPKIIAMIDESTGTGICVGYENDEGYSYNIIGHDSDGWADRREVVTNKIEGKKEIVRLFSKEEQRDLVLLIQALQEKIPVSREREWRTFKAITEEAKYVFAVDSVSGTVSIKGDDENEGDIELARAIAQKKELAKKIETTLLQIRNPKARSEEKKESSDAETIMLEKENASLKAKLRISEGYAKELEKKTIRMKNELVRAEALLKKASFLNGNKEEVQRIIKELLEEV